MSTRSRAPFGNTHSMGQKSTSTEVGVPGVYGCASIACVVGNASVAAPSRISSAFPSCSEISRATKAVSGAVDETLSVRCAVPESVVSSVNGAPLNVSTSPRAQLSPWSTGPGVMPRLRKNAKDNIDAPPREGTGSFGSNTYVVCELAVGAASSVPPVHAWDAAAPPSCSVVSGFVASGHSRCVRHTWSPGPSVRTSPFFSVTSGLPFR